jgi:hypothetical protein
MNVVYAILAIVGWLWLAVVAVFLAVRLRTRRDDSAAGLRAIAKHD